jgi:hypothetical protein
MLLRLKLSFDTLESEPRQIDAITEVLYIDRYVSYRKIGTVAILSFTARESNSGMTKSFAQKNRVCPPAGLLSAAPRKTAVGR